jgi:hypothetical protein
LGRLRGAGRHQIGHAFGLGEVDAAVQESAQAELPRLRQPCPLAQALLQRGLNHHDAAVAVQLHYVLAGVGAGSLHPDGQGLVQPPALLVVDPAVEEAMAFPDCVAAGGSKDSLGNGQSPRTGEAYNANAALFGHHCRGNGSNGIGQGRSQIHPRQSPA